MKTIFDPQTRGEIISRIHTLQESSGALWGRMNAFQMVRHCVRCEELYLGKVQVKRSFLGRIFGKRALKNLLKEETPLRRNAPTSPYFIVQEVSGSFEEEKQRWAALIREYEPFSADSFVHWFFGPMTREQIGQFVYKHNDHHLRQFNA